MNPEKPKVDKEAFEIALLYSRGELTDVQYNWRINQAGLSKEEVDEIAKDVLVVNINPLFIFIVVFLFFGLVSFLLSTLGF